MMHMVKWCSKEQQLGHSLKMTVMLEPPNDLRFVADCAAKKWPFGQPLVRSLRQSKLLPPRGRCV
jgi:hypothetical protein